jgi:hypothetical protein
MGVKEEFLEETRTMDDTVLMDWIIGLKLDIANIALDLSENEKKTPQYKRDAEWVSKAQYAQKMAQIRLEVCRCEKQKREFVADAIERNKQWLIDHGQMFIKAAKEILEQDQFREIWALADRYIKQNEAEDKSGTR